MKQFRKIITAGALLIMSLIILVSGCSSPNPVQKIIILPRPPDSTIPPGGWGMDPSTVPFPTNIQETFNPGQEMLIGIKLDKRFNSEITFSKVTLLHRETSEEVEIISHDLGPFEPGQVFYLPYYSVPSKQGIYEVRVYLNQKVIASALFEVR